VPTLRGQTKTRIVKEHASQVAPIFVRAAESEAFLPPFRPRYACRARSAQHLLRNLQCPEEIEENLS